MKISSPIPGRSESVGIDSPFTHAVIGMAMETHNALGRPADRIEVEREQQFFAAARENLRESGTPPDQLEAEAWPALVRVIFRLNEFVYLD